MGNCGEWKARHRAGYDREPGLPPTRVPERHRPCAARAHLKQLRPPETAKEPKVGRVRLSAASRRVLCERSGDHCDKRTTPRLLV